MVAEGVILGPPISDYILITPAVREVEANAKNGDLDIMHSPHYVQFLNGSKINYQKCQASADSFVQAFADYLNFRAKSAAAQ